MEYIFFRNTKYFIIADREYYSYTFKISLAFVKIYSSKKMHDSKIQYLERAFIVT